MARSDPFATLERFRCFYTCIHFSVQFSVERENCSLHFTICFGFFDVKRVWQEHSKCEFLLFSYISFNSLGFFLLCFVSLLFQFIMEISLLHINWSQVWLSSWLQCFFSFSLFFFFMFFSFLFIICHQSLLLRLS